MKKARLSGPLRRAELHSMPKAPSADLLSVICKDRQQQPVKNGEGIYKNMNYAEFNDYLKSFIDGGPRSQSVDDDKVCLPRELKLSSKAEFISNLVQTYYRDKIATSLKKHLNLGFHLIAARAKFRQNRNVWKVSDPWGKWVMTTTGMSDSYVRKHIVVARLCQNYTRLEQLSMMFTSFYRLKSKIDRMFNDRPDIAAQWK